MDILLIATKFVVMCHTQIHINTYLKILLILYEMLSDFSPRYPLLPFSHEVFRLPQTDNRAVSLHLCKDTAAEMPMTTFMPSSVSHSQEPHEIVPSFQMGKPRY